MRKKIFALTLKSLPALLIIASLSSCFLPGISYRNQEVERFVGRSESELIQYFGNPRAVEYDSQGRKILVFEWTSKETVQEEGRSWTDSSGVTHYTAPSSRISTTIEQRKFTIGKDGKVIKGQWRFY